jgi:hypothetical protein
MSEPKTIAEALEWVSAADMRAHLAIQRAEALEAQLDDIRRFPRFHAIQETPMPDEHSSLIGGSSARKRIQCPASYRLEHAVPGYGSGNDSNAFTREGTMLHGAVELCLRGDLTGLELLGRFLDDGEGGQIEVTAEHAGLINDCLNLVDILIAEHCPNGEDYEIYLEVKAQFPLISGAFGTCDVCMIFPHASKAVLIDWKFGGGVPVKAVYAGDDVDVINEQILYYLAACRSTLAKQFQGLTSFDLHIFQPRMLPDGHSVAQDVDTTEVELFIGDVVKAVGLMSQDPPVAPTRGDWCRWCAAKPSCPQHTGPLLDLAALGAKLPERAVDMVKEGSKAKPKKVKALAAPPPNDYAEILAAGLDLIALVEDMMGELKTQAHNALESGIKLKGWKLVDKRATRSWADESKVPDYLTEQGLKISQVWEETLVSPAQAEKLLKANLGKAVELTPETTDGLIKKVSSGTTLAPDEDARPVAGTDLRETIARFAAAISPKP